MNLTDPFQQLVRHRLWPLAVVLLAVLIAAPLMLRHDGSTPAAAAEVAPGPTGPAADSPVALAAASSPDKVRPVLGARKDPFRPAHVKRIRADKSKQHVPLPKSYKAAVAKIGASGAAAGAAAGSADTGTSSGGGSGAAPAATVEPVTTPVPVATPVVPAKPQYPAGSLVAQFGDVTTDLAVRTVKRMTALPAGKPAAVYLGSRGRQATFTIVAGVRPAGDGRCHPSPADCRTLTLKAGGTEFFTRGTKTFEIDLMRVIPGPPPEAVPAAKASVKPAATPSTIDSSG